MKPSWDDLAAKICQKLLDGEIKSFELITQKIACSVSINIYCCFGHSDRVEILAKKYLYNYIVLYAWFSTPFLLWYAEQEEQFKLYMFFMWCRQKSGVFIPGPLWKYSIMTEGCFWYFAPFLVLFLFLHILQMGEKWLMCPCVIALVNASR